MHVYEVRSGKGKRGVDLISDVLHFVACGTAQLCCDDRRNWLCEIS